MKVTIEYLGGPRDGVCTFDWPIPLDVLERPDFTDEGQAKMFYFATDEGQVGRGLKMSAPAQTEIMRTQGIGALKDSNLHGCTYAVVSRDDVDDGVLVRAKYCGDGRS
jgi:hypothetical protein